MKVVVLANDSLKAELMAQGVAGDGNIEWIDNAASFDGHRDADAWIDLLFDGSKERVNRLQTLLPKPVVINAVLTTLKDLPAGFIRINGWNTFLSRPVIEAAANDTGSKIAAEKIFHCFTKKTEWVPDVPGFVSARVVAMIINEAYLALAEEVSTKEEIDTAMKLGTNYPYGPFEWSKKIGVKKINALLEILVTDQTRYGPALLLQKEIA